MNYWSRQDVNTPLFPELLWSKPENKRHAGKLLIIGGNLHGFSAPASAYNAAEKAGIGSSRVLLPDAIRKTVGAFMPEADFGPSTPSGSFAGSSLDMWLENSGWADGVLVAGDLGKNSETAIVLEKFLTKQPSELILTKDAVDYFTANPSLVLDRPNTTLVISFAQLQKIGTASKFSVPLTYGMDLLQLVKALHEFSELHSARIVVKHHNVILAACEGMVSTTRLVPDAETWRVEYAARVSVWLIQHPAKPFEAITTAVC